MTIEEAKCLKVGDKVIIGHNFYIDPKYRGRQAIVVGPIPEEYPLAIYTIIKVDNKKIGVKPWSITRKYD